jgi:DNA invertase Pin-like site-specific DNA recombinase
MGFEKEDGRGLMRIGYARVSTDDQSLDLQLDALKAGGCQRIFTDKVSTTKADHPGLAEAVSHLRHGDVLVIWKLDRLGRTVRGLVDFVADLQERKIQLRSLTDGIDTTTPAGRFFFTLWRRWPRWSGSCWPNARVPGWPRRGGGAGSATANDG